MKARSFLSGLLALSPFVIALGCGVEEQPPGAEVLSRSGQPIINGTKDTTHDAVVAILAQDGECTGTVIHKDVAAKKGFVLTAAHCLEEAPELVVRGTDYKTGTTYEVVDYKAHQQYDGEIYDFGMITFTWTQSEPPVIPFLKKAQDNMAVGSTVNFVGYGITSANPNSPGYNNSIRYQVEGQLDQLDALTIHYNQSSFGQYSNDSGPCSGDSGGPALYTVAGVGETVAAVTSYGDQQCVKFGVSSRVSAVEAWIQDYLANGSSGSGGQDCQSCADGSTDNGGACGASVDVCFNDPACAALVQCYNNCQSQACFEQCDANNPNGLPEYDAIITCICTSGCATECASDPDCQQFGPACGLTGDGSTCQSCFEGACCAEAQTCTGDQGCASCWNGKYEDLNCAGSNMAAAALGACMNQHCSAQCGIPSNNGAGGAAGSGASGGSAGSGGSDGDDGSCACRTGAGGEGPSGAAALALGAALMGLFASRRSRGGARR